MQPPTTQNITITKIQFPEIQLKTRDAHKLRGYFGELFKEHSPLLHNHYQDGSLRYRYPQIQYKIINKTPNLIGLEEGADLLTQLFLKIKEVNINGKTYPVHTKNISQQQIEIGYSHELHEYKFETLWMGLNQQNYSKFVKFETDKERDAMLNSILTGHILGFFRTFGVALMPEERIMVKHQLQQKSTKFKGQKMLAFKGGFVCNVKLPDYIGLGKSTSRGFGTIKLI
ncbi:MAG: CRISPR-associated endonuclease Cas6 [Psychroflexus sp.]